MSKKARVFVPLTKVDEEQRLVYGRITQEILDKSQEVMDYDSSKPFFEKWSKDIHDNSGGLSKGNLRVMHGLTAAGKLTELDFNDAEKAIDVCAKVVDEAEWIKVTEGVYTGFSVGGRYEKKWTETVGDEKIKKFTAGPNEVSLVDNPCVPTAHFTMFKADGSETVVPFKVDNDDEAWPDFAKADDDDDTPAASVETQAEVIQPELDFPTNDEVVAQAEKMAKAAGDPEKSWMNFVEEARDELIKATKKAKPDGKEKTDASEANADAKTGEGEPEADKSTKVTPAGVKQVWTASDGKTFEKKDEAVAHELTLEKAEPTEAEKLKQRLDKALAPEAEVDTVSVYEDFDRLGKAVQAILTPFGEDGKPVLEKGMYTVSRFANVLWDLGSLARKIAKESAGEGDDATDRKVSDEIKTAMSSLGDSFKVYVDDQITELIAGIDDEVCVAYYDYYCAAAKENGEDQLAKDVCSIIEDRRDPSRERREELTKVFGLVSAESDDAEMNPSLQKRFDKLTEENGELKKIAEEAVASVEKLNKRVETIENTPLPRAPRHIALKEGDEQLFFGKSTNSEEERIAILKQMIEQDGPEGVALKLIKAAHNTGGQRLTLQR